MVLPLAGLREILQVVVHHRGIYSDGPAASEMCCHCAARARGPLPAGGVPMSMGTGRLARP